MQLFNTRSNKIEKFVPLKENEVSLYVCGPTVYNHAHIGNARPIAVFDTLKKVFEALGYQVHFVSNYTDIDDKIIKQAKQENRSEKEISEQYIKAYEQVRRQLNADIPDQTPRVTQTIEAIIDYIENLIDLGVAYESNGDVYFKIDAVDNYGSLSHQILDELMVGARIEENQNKDNPLDFVLWKKTEDDGIKWDSPWGQGRPGWHTECVVMIHQEFNTSKIDIHGGGQDLKFPHHENEVAQNCASHDSDLANYWVHNAMINVDGEKMSKSLGNVRLAKDIIEQLGSNVVRWLLVSPHYRQTFNLTDDTIEQAQSELNKVYLPMKQAHLILQLENRLGDQFDVDHFNRFLEPMKDDLNTPNAISALFEVVKELNQALRTKEKDLDEISGLFNSVRQMLFILGIEFDFVDLDHQQRQLVQQWEMAKKEKNFEVADKLRAQLSDQGIL